MPCCWSEPGWESLPAPLLCSTRMRAVCFRPSQPSAQKYGARRSLRAQPPVLNPHAALPCTHRRPAVQAGNRLLLGVVHPGPLCRGQPVRRQSLRQPVWWRPPASLLARIRPAPRLQRRGSGRAPPAASHQVRPVHLPGLPGEHAAGARTELLAAPCLRILGILHAWPLLLQAHSATAGSRLTGTPHAWSAGLTLRRPADTPRPVTVARVRGARRARSPLRM
jgi:hypothetical protein